MGKAVMISASPQQCENILNGSQTILPKKTAPNLQVPFKCYIYCTKEGHVLLKRQFDNEVDIIQKTDIDVYNRPYVCNGKVIGEFICDRIDRIFSRGIDHNFDYCYLSLNRWGNDDIELEILSTRKTLLSKNELNEYGKGKNVLYYWHISQLKIYDKPKELSEFWTAKCVNKKVKSCGECDIVGCMKHITRPPQSWGYVEV